jgi:hypothetical protein
MREDEGSSTSAPHPLEFLEELEKRASVEQEGLLRGSATPWARLLVEYADALNELVAQGYRFDMPHQEMQSFDEGHAGGCG